MTVVDDRGRVFGRWNIVDVLIGLVLLAAIPLLYGGYVLFRSHPATITAVEPSRIQARSTVQVTVRGTNLRPFMRVSFGDNQGRSYLFADATKAVVQVVDLPPGVYDVILYDNAQERARLPQAFTVLAPPTAQAQLDVIASFMAIDEAVVSQIKPQTRIEGLGEIIRVGKPVPGQTTATVGPSEAVAMKAAPAVNVPVVIRVTCALVERGASVSCMAMDHPLTRDTVLTVPVAAAGQLLRIDQVRAVGAESTVELRVRFAAERSVLELIHRGDQDVDRSNEFAAGAEVMSVGAIARAVPALIIAEQSQPLSAPVLAAGDIATVEATLRVPAQQTLEGWSYHGQPLKPGRSLMFRHRDYEVSATMLSVTAK